MQHSVVMLYGQLCSCTLCSTNFVTDRALFIPLPSSFSSPQLNLPPSLYIFLFFALSLPSSVSDCFSLTLSLSSSPLPICFPISLSFTPSLILPFTYLFPYISIIYSLSSLTFHLINISWVTGSTDRLSTPDSIISISLNLFPSLYLHPFSLLVHLFFSHPQLLILPISLSPPTLNLPPSLKGQGLVWMLVFTQLLHL